jgi:SAM-dependent methyltransferase
MAEEIENKTITSEFREIIENEAFRTALPIRYEDPETAELVEELVRDYKESQYLFLQWLKETYQPEKILYAGSGNDGFPKYIFGRERVFHTSLEEYETDKTRYFPSLGEGIKVVADNVHLPFPEESFDMVITFCLFTETTAEQIKDLVRVLKAGGLIVCDNVVSQNIDLGQVSADLREMPVPSNFQQRGISETSFAVYKKSKIIV